MARQRAVPCAAKLFGLSETARERATHANETMRKHDAPSATKASGAARGRRGRRCAARAARRAPTSRTSRRSISTRLTAHHAFLRRISPIDRRTRAVTRRPGTRVQQRGALDTQPPTRCLGQLLPLRTLSEGCSTAPEGGDRHHRLDRRNLGARRRSIPARRDSPAAGLARCSGSRNVSRRSARRRGFSKNRGGLHASLKVRRCGVSARTVARADRHAAPV
jgi:hypothetical protein